MITSLFLSIPPGTTYEQMRGNIHFVQDFAGVSNWVMRPPRLAYSTDLRNRHTFTPQRIVVDSVSQPNLQERWKYFVITKGDGRRYYCTAQIYYERGSLKFEEKTLLSAAREVYRQFWLPRCLILLSELPYYKLQVNLLKVHRELRRQEPIISHSVSQNAYRLFLQLVNEGRQVEWDQIVVRQGLQGRMITPSKEFTFNYYINKCNEQRLGEALFIEKRTNRQVLHVYKLQAQSFYELSYFFHLPFSSQTLRLILSAILQEKQILFASNNANLTTLVIETLMKMIMPLKWCYMYVPNLPSHLIQPAQESFMPYIAGVAKKNLNQIDTSERFVVDIQENKVTYNGEMFLFHSQLMEYLFYQQTNTRNYLQWQKQIRIKSLMFIHTILEDCLRFQQPKTQRSLATSIVSLGGNSSSIRSIQRLPSTSHFSEEHHAQFIEQFVNNSMMYKHFKQNSNKGLTEESYRLVHLNKDQRRIYLNGKFNIISTQAQYPIRFDNQKEYIKYYDKMNNRRKYSNSNRYSLNKNEASMIVQTVRQQGMNSVMSSHFIQSRVFSQSSVFS